MKFIHEDKRKTEVITETDVLVIGGGPSGFAAAVSAARLGLQVTLIEQYGFLGGLATGGLIISMIETDRYGYGICRELIDKLAAMNSAKSYSGPEVDKPEWTEGAALSGEGIVDFDPEMFKFTADEMVTDSGVELFLYAHAVDIVKEGNRIKGVIIESKSGRQAILSKMTVDATGDGDICAWINAPFVIDKHSWGIDLGYRFGGVDSEQALQWQKQKPDEYRQLLQELHQQTGDFEINWERTVRKEMIWGEAGKIKDADALNIKDLTRVTIETRKKIFVALEMFRSKLPGFESAYLIDTSPLPGVRETRKIIGEYTLTRDDIIAGRTFPDTISTSLFDIPYRCLVPQKVDNLVVSGRCISVSHEAHGNIRNIPPCIITGQAAGTAAALSVKNSVEPRKLAIKELQTSLIKQGLYLGDAQRLKSLQL